MAASSDSDDGNFWRVDSGSEDAYWDAYEATRPNYADSSFCEHMYTYHTSKSSLPTASFAVSPSFGVAHDVGCGSGVASGEFARRFQHVIASDNNASSLDAARRRLTVTLPANKLSFLECRGEELVLYHPPQSADFIGAAECLPLMDAPIALSGFARLLKPGGTLAIWFYGRPHFSEPEYKASCQLLFDFIMDRSFAKVIKGGGPERKAAWKKAADGMASWLDYLDFSTGQWELVQRWKWNSKSAKMGFFGPEACDFNIEPTSSIGETDEVIEKEDSEMWKGTWNVQGVKNFVKVSFPNFKEKVEADSEIERCFGKLTEAMGGEDAVRSYTWPVVLILATRSRS
ncbi:MAG: hypothetical protein Q9187_004394 [Circinaria calcarea]